MASGSAVVRGGRGEIQIHVGDVIVIPGRLDYTVVNNGAETLHLEIVELEHQVEEHLK